MRIKLDENMPGGAARRLRELGHDADTALDEGLGGKSDLDVWTAAQAEGRFFITHDLDFSDVRKFTPGTHHGTLVVASSRKIRVVRKGPSVVDPEP